MPNCTQPEMIRAIDARYIIHYSDGTELNMVFRLWSVQVFESYLEHEKRKDERFGTVKIVDWKREF